MAGAPEVVVRVGSLSAISAPTGPTRRGLFSSLLFRHLQESQHLIRFRPKPGFPIPSSSANVQTFDHFGPCRVGPRPCCLTLHILSFRVRSHLGFRPHVYTWLGYSPLSHKVTPYIYDRPYPRLRCQRNTLPRSLSWGYFFSAVRSHQKPTATCVRCLAYNALVVQR
jgi:hypothetical protein